ncbi:ACT domain-containing protein [Bacillus pumilus]|uniref:ACT domain-containing protein n=1 Tax=Bacillus pumilus TaxID=1408 RepID=UPI0011E98140|nr:ACT domain-containing protein [Bacillus pumilus]TYS30976.1 ACT domain-containing protein [Bacillus pumilus]TYS45759.1 ACT domain-containing protein [Bacillus pumilus]
MNKNPNHNLKLLEDTYAVSKVSNESPFFNLDQVFCIMKEVHVTTYIYKQDQIENEHFLEVSHGWRVLKIDAALDFSQTGVLHSIITPLSESEISILAVSTFDTDYIFVKEEDLDKALYTLKIAGYQFN